MPPDLVVRLVAVHSRNKPDTIRAEMNNLRYSLAVTNLVVDTVKKLSEFMDRAGELSDEYLRELAYTSPKIVTFLFNYAAAYSDNFNQYEAEERFYGAEQLLRDNPLPVSGDDLVSMGMKPGPEFRILLDKFKKMYINNPQTPKEDYLQLLRK
jgi:hypothetical protein